MTASSTERKPRRGDRLEVTIERQDRKGPGIASSGDHQVRVRGAVIGEQLAVEVLKRRGRRVEARAVERLAGGPHLEPARCPHFGTCGGCSFQTLAYGMQLTELHRHVREVLAAEGIECEVDGVEGMADPWMYRNKMDFTFANRRWVEPDEPQGVDASFALGLHVPGRFDKVMDLTSCAIHFEGADELVTSVRELARERGLEPWDVRAHRGLLRHLVLRKGIRTGEVLVDLVTSEDAEEVVDEFSAALLHRHPWITTVVQNVNTRPAAIAVGEYERVLHGPGVIHEELGGLRFAISANSFFQTNTLQAERLLEMVSEEAAVQAGDVVFDLYCGAGTLGLGLAHGGVRVFGFEVVPSAVADARANAEANGVTDAEFHEGDVLDALGMSGPELPSPDVCIVDPPRAGLHPKVVPSVAELGARRIVYVSCNVASAARDLPVLIEGGYALARVRPIDLFPHTPHVEVVFTLERRQS